eukprot:6457363-Amphidinium_carterae.1
MGPEVQYYKSEGSFILKRVKWMTSSSEIAEVLKKDGKSKLYRKVRLAAQEAAGAAQYPTELIARVTQSLRRQLLDLVLVDGRVDATSLYAAGPVADFPEPDLSEWEDVYDIHGNLLEAHKVNAGRQEVLEIEWILKQDFFHYVLEQECFDKQGKQAWASTGGCSVRRLTSTLLRTLRQRRVRQTTAGTP